MFLFLILTILGCKNTPEKQARVIEQKPTEIASVVQQEMTEQEIITHVSNYKRLKNRILTRREILKQKELQNLVLIKEDLSNTLIDSIFPYWIGTKWDFEGHTEEPLKGEIACGYFVTTTVRDVGIKINRYKIAQKAASEIISSLCDQNSIEQVSSIDEIKEYMETVKDYELIVVGLDYHVGFIYKKQGKHYFAHSNYIDREGVMIELIDQSEALRHSELYVLGNLTRNEQLITNWLHGKYYP